MTENKLYLFIGIPSEGVLVFNPLGEYITTLMIPGIVDFKVRKNILMFYQDYCIHKYDLKDHTRQVTPLPGNLDIINAHNLGKAIVVQTPDKILIYENPGEKMTKRQNE